MSNIEAMFAGMETAKQMATGQHFKGEGNFVLQPKLMKVNSGHKGRFFIAEFTVLESSSPLDPVGCTRSWAVPLEGERSKYSFGDIKGLIFAISGDDPKTVGAPEESPKAHQEAAQMVMAICDADYAKKHGLEEVASLLLSNQIKLTTFFKSTRPTPQKPQGGTFTVHQWSPADAPAEGSA